MTTLTTAMKRLGAIIVTAVIVIAGLAMPNSPWEKRTTAQAQAQTTRNWGSNENMFHQCSFRRGTGDVAEYAQQLCWIDMAGLLQVLSPTPTRVTKDMGRYEMSFTVNLLPYSERAGGGSTNWSTDVNQFNVLSGPVNNRVFGNEIEGVQYFKPFAGDSGTPAVTFTNPSSLRESNQMAKVQFRDIRIKDKATGQNVKDFRITAIDAEATESGLYGENMSFDAPELNQDMHLYRRITPPGFYPACDPNRHPNSILGTGEESYYNRGDNTFKDVYCKENTSYTNPAGTYILGGDGVRSLDVGLFTRYRTQAFALALNMGRMTGSVAPVDSTMEKAVTGQATSFDFSMATRLGSTETPVPWQGEGTYTQALRTMDPFNAVGTIARDSMVFRSAAQGSQKNLAFNRYAPSWQCTDPTDATKNITVKEGSVPAGKGVTLEKDAATGTSTLVMENKTSVPVTCKVTWTPKFKPSSLNLRKSVSGTAKNYKDIQLLTYDIGYSCTEPQGFKAAYPDIKLADSRELADGAGYTVTGLPAGATCTLSEKNTQASPGTQLKLTWTGTAVTTGTGAIPTATVKLAEGANNAVGVSSAVAGNAFEARTGTVNVSKHIHGEAVDKLGSPRDYRFELICDSANYDQIVTMKTTSAGANQLDGTAQFTGVPLERDCLLKPLSGLSGTETETIVFDGRTLKFDGAVVEKNQAEAYPLKVPDSGQDTNVSTVTIDARYSFQRRDVRVQKNLIGPAAAKVPAGGTYEVSYVCESPNDAAGKVEGTLQLSSGSENAQYIKGARVGSECRIWESKQPEFPNQVVDRTRITASNTSDQVTSLTNEEAKSKPVLKVEDTTDSKQNAVTVSNHYVSRLATVDLQKLVRAELGISNLLPADYEVSFDCGVRNIETSEGQYANADLRGKLRLGGGETKRLVADVADPAQASLVNDGPSGSMRVPYGNTCRFSEKDPDTVRGLDWSSNVGSLSLEVGKPEEKVDLVNTFKAAGDGVTIKQRTAGIRNFAQPVEYSLECQASNGTPLDLGEHARFTLQPGETSHQVPSSSIPESSTCQVKEINADDGKREGGYEITRNSTLKTDELAKSFDTGQGVDSGVFTVGPQTVVNIAHTYDYADKKMTITKNVVFDGETADYISQVRKNVKYRREFDVSVVCTPPDGGVVVSHNGKVSSPQSDNPQTQKLEFGDVPDGSTCRVTEGDTTAAEGITFTQEVEAVGQRAEKTLEFTVNGDTPVSLINTYKRQLAKVDLTKIANTPIDIEKAKPDVTGDSVYYTHNFTMVCKDPEGSAAESGELPPVEVKQITGPGHTEFVNVPVGADCSITGDKFGQLDLKKAQGEGKPTLETHLIPQKVEWRLQRNDAEPFIDSEVKEGTTTSQQIPIKADNADGTSNNVLTLTNYYDFVKSKLGMSKKIVASDDDMRILRNAKPGVNFSFSYQCQGVGYSTSNIGLPTTLTAGDSEKFADPNRVFKATEVEVPSGAWCTATEGEPSLTPPELTWSADALEISKRVGSAESSVESFDFVNTYKRRTVPVRIVPMQDGYLGGADRADYEYDLACKDPSGTQKSFSIAAANTNSTYTVTDSTEPSGGSVVELPVGYDCTLDLSKSSALQPRVQLESTRSERTPYVEFGKWVGGQPDAKNPTKKLASLTADEVTDAMKKYSFDFRIDPKLQSRSGEPVMTLGAEAMHLRDRVDVTFTKTSTGAAGEGKTFNFASSCGDASFNLKSGESHTLKGIEVERNCTIREQTAEGHVGAVVSVESSGERLGNPTARTTNDTDGRLAGGTWTFDVLPVSTPTDLSTNGAKWAFTAKNSFPGLKVKKKIDGAPISALSGAVADTAILPDSAETMRFTYEVENEGALAVGNFLFKEPELAGFTVRNDAGEEFTINNNGLIPAAVCSVGDAGRLAPGDKKNCSFDVLINQDTDTAFTYKGTVSVTAEAYAKETDAAPVSQVSASDTYGALRLSGLLAAMLPDTGMQTLVWMLVLGLAVLGLGLWIYMRNREDDDEAEE
ncbi:DUF5979 domain-containing protein [Corynebacterium minutissimum]|uniref:DUF5979 domain-containing protein n=1 Tax=Corynebacterium minutissimum TaxID=38301 RepID=UPI001EF3CF4A|nr:DUF5979 domain-containing protein [Corynebacterium minutissimum]MCG7228839.1 DUF5979 domain-containing protein [Corynebacterium minutissimum]MCG7237956.1 DUF5979 domain-containing protein [Corynebacterium minutissimum]